MFDENNYSNDNTHSQTMAGGAIRVTHGASAPGAAPANVAPSTRVDGGTLRWNAGGGASQSGVTRFAHNPAGSTGGDIMASRQRLNGHETVCYEPGNEGTRVQLAFALQEGYIREVAPGVYEDARRSQAVDLPRQAAAQPVQLPGQEHTATSDGAASELVGVFDPQEDSVWQSEVADLSEHAYDAAIALGTNAMGLGQSMAAAVASLAVNTGMDPARAEEVISKGHAYFANMAARAATNAGVPQDQLDTFWAQCMNNPGEFMPAVQFMTYFRDVSRIQAMARAWVGKKG